MNPIRQRIVDEYTAVTGRHDEPKIYAQPSGDPGLTGPGSMSWEIHSDPAALALAATAAVIMEIMHPSVMAGVHDQSDYQTEPFKRARNTGGYVLITTFGNTQAATRTIERVRRMHSRVNGTRPDGVEYEALDPVLIGWVHTCIPWAVMRAFERYNRPLSDAERDRYLSEQAVIGRAGGAGDIPETAAELDEYVEAMRPQLAVNEQTLEFFEFLLVAPWGPDLPDVVSRRVNLFNVHASMSVMPDWARKLTGFHHPDLVQRLVYEPHIQLTARALRWAFGTTPSRALSDERTQAASISAVAATSAEAATAAGSRI